MKLQQQSRLTQRLALTPSLQQAIRLLQFSGKDLNREIQRILQENPLLEREGHSLKNARLSFENDSDTQPATETSETTLSGIETPESFLKADDRLVQPQMEAQPLSLRNHLTSQIRLTSANRRQLALAELIIDALDKNGYLAEMLDDILKWLPGELDIQLSELESALELVQAQEPAGIAARSSAECIAIQLRRRPHLPYVTRKRALAIIENHFVLFIRRDFSRLKTLLRCDDEDMIEARQAIQSCNPHPGAAFSTEEAHTLIPELLIFQQEGRWQARLNPAAIPNIRINTLYADAMKNTENPHALTTQLQEANWFLRNLRQRFDTILRTGQAIVERQQKFFSDGAASMRPLVLREIADTLELHESTISRVTNQKYMHTPHGIFELKYFFGSHLQTESGGTVSSTAVREQIKQLIGAEEPGKPLSDNRIAQMLGEQGLVIARRTVAKYRETLKIPPARMRKSLYR